MKRLLLLILSTLATYGSWAGELAISRVQADRAVFDPLKGEAVHIRFQLSAPARVRLQLYDGRDLSMRSIRSAEVLPMGEGSLKWDGKDETGKVVPPEAYVFTLDAQGVDGSTAHYDVADVTAGEAVVARLVEWNPATKRVSYVIDKPARIRVRVGLQENGPLLRTIANWVVRDAGSNQEPWDGLDASGNVDLSKHAQLAIGVSGFSLARNTVLVGKSGGEVALIEHPAWEPERRPKQAPGEKRMYEHAKQPLEARGDFPVELLLPPELPRNAEGAVVLHNTAVVPVRLEVPERSRERVLSDRFEPVFFVDGQYVFENEVGFIPMTWNWDPSGLNPGEHFLTVNLRGYEGNFGVATVKVLVVGAGEKREKR